MWISIIVMKLVVQDYFEDFWNICKLVAFSSLTVAPLAVSCATPPVWTALPGHDRDRSPNIGTVPVKTGRLATMHCIGLCGGQDCFFLLSVSTS